MRTIDKAAALLVSFLCVTAFLVAGLNAGSSCYKPKPNCVVPAVVAEPSPHLELQQCGNTNNPPSIGVLASNGETGKKASDTACASFLGITCNPTLGDTCKE